MVFDFTKTRFDIDRLKLEAVIHKQRKGIIIMEIADRLFRCLI